MPIEVAEWAGVAEVDATAWDATVAPGGFYAAMPWLRVAEATADLPPLYLVATATAAAATAAGVPMVGTLPCYPVAASSPFPLCRADNIARHLSSDHRPGDHRAVDQWPGGQRPGGQRLGDQRTGGQWPGGDRAAASLMPSLFCGGRNPAHTRVNLAGGRHAAPSAPVASVAPVAAATPAVVVDALLERAERAAGERGLCSVGMLYVDGDDTVTRQVLTGRGYLGFPHGPAAVLELSGPGFDSYLNGLTKKRRATVRAERRRLAAAGVEFRMCPLHDRLNDEIDRLEEAVNAKYGGAFDPLAVRRLRQSVTALLPGVAWVGLAEIGGRCCGSVVFFHWRDELYARTVGFDYELTAGLPVYFGLLYYALIEHAGRVGARRIWYSTGAEEAKASRGCRLVPQYAYLKPLTC